MQVTTDVLGVLDSAICLDNTLKLTGQLDRKLYTATNKVLEAAGGKWNRKAQAHIFEGDAFETIEQVILTGAIVDRKQELQYFPTPEPVAERLVELADLQYDMKVLEPSAGQGALVAPLLREHAEVLAIEIDSGNAKKLATLFTSQGAFFDSILQADFLHVQPESTGLFDRVVMNPPFTRQQDIRHVTHAFRFLKPGGRLVAVMSAAISFRTDSVTRAFRTLMEANEGTIEALPQGSFKASGTGVNTVIVTMERTWP